jgi:hypothetical protein
MQNRPRSFHCLAGHDIPEHSLQTLTVTETLDRGATVQLCREHGTPIAVRVEARTDLFEDIPETARQGTD